LLTASTRTSIDSENWVLTAGESEIAALPACALANSMREQIS
jgi:hypothetical protein